MSKVFLLISLKMYLKRHKKVFEFVYKALLILFLIAISIILVLILVVAKENKEVDITIANQTDVPQESSTPTNRPNVKIIHTLPVNRKKFDPKKLCEYYCTHDQSKAGYKCDCDRSPMFDEEGQWYRLHITDIYYNILL